MVSLTSSTSAATRAAGFLVLRVDLLVEEGQVHAHAGQRLAELVVDLARDAHALLFAHGFDVGGQGAQLLARPPLLLLKLSALGDVMAKAGGSDHLSRGIENRRLEGFDPAEHARGRRSAPRPASAAGSA